MPDIKLLYSDARYQSLDEAGKAKAIQNYFNKYVATDARYINGDDTVKQTAQQRFVEKHVAPYEKNINPFQPGLNLSKFAGDTSVTESMGQGNKFLPKDKVFTDEEKQSLRQSVSDARVNSAIPTVSPLAPEDYLKIEYDTVKEKTRQIADYNPSGAVGRWGNAFNTGLVSMASGLLRLGTKNQLPDEMSKRLFNYLGAVEDGFLEASAGSTDNPAKPEDNKTFLQDIASGRIDIVADRAIRYFAQSAPTTAGFILSKGLGYGLAGAQGYGQQTRQQEGEDYSDLTKEASSILYGIFSAITEGFGFEVGLKNWLRLAKTLPEQEFKSSFSAAMKPNMAKLFMKESAISSLAESGESFSEVWLDDFSDAILGKDVDLSKTLMKSINAAAEGFASSAPQSGIMGVHTYANRNKFAAIQKNIDKLANIDINSIKDKKNAESIIAKSKIANNINMGINLIKSKDYEGGVEKLMESYVALTTNPEAQQDKELSKMGMFTAMAIDAAHQEYKADNVKPETVAEPSKTDTEQELLDKIVAVSEKVKSGNYTTEQIAGFKQELNQYKNQLLEMSNGKVQAQEQAKNEVTNEAKPISETTVKENNQEAVASPTGTVQEARQEVTTKPKATEQDRINAKVRELSKYVEQGLDFSDAEEKFINDHKTEIDNEVNKIKEEKERLIKLKKTNPIAFAFRKFDDAIKKGGELYGHLQDKVTTLKRVLPKKVGGLPIDTVTPFGDDKEANFIITYSDDVALISIILNNEDIVGKTDEEIKNIINERANREVVIEYSKPQPTETKQPRTIKENLKVENAQPVTEAQPATGMIEAPEELFNNSAKLLKDTEKEILKYKGIIKTDPKNESAKKKLKALYKQRTEIKDMAETGWIYSESPLLKSLHPTEQKQPKLVKKAPSVAKTEQVKAENAETIEQKPKLVKTEWKATVDFQTGKKVSTWEDAEHSEISGKDVVHVYWIEHNGETKPYGIKSASKMLGIKEQSLRTKANADLRKLQYDKQIRKQEKKLNQNNIEKNISHTATNAKTYAKWNLNIWNENTKNYNPERLAKELNVVEYKGKYTLAMDEEASDYVEIGAINHGKVNDILQATPEAKPEPKPVQKKTVTDKPEVKSTEEYAYIDAQKEMVRNVPVDNDIAYYKKILTQLNKAKKDGYKTVKMGSAVGTEVLSTEDAISYVTNQLNLAQKDKQSGNDYRVPSMSNSKLVTEAADTIQQAIEATPDTAEDLSDKLSKLKNKLIKTKDQEYLDSLAAVTPQQAEDAIIGMMPQHQIAGITKPDENSIRIDFRDGRQVTINHKSGLISVVRKGENRYAYGRMKPGLTIDGKVSAVIDIATNWNNGNVKGYHEGFHLAYYMFLNDAQRNQILSYYKSKNLAEYNKILAEEGAYSADEYLEEKAADAFALWAVKQENKSAIGKLWAKLINRINHFMVSMGFASDAVGITDMFDAIKHGKYVNSQSIISQAKNMLANVYHGSGAFFDRFSTDFIGTGEGAQAFGWGIYVTERRGVAKDVYVQDKITKYITDWDEYDSLEDAFDEEDNWRDTLREITNNELIKINNLSMDSKEIRKMFDDSDDEIEFFSNDLLNAFYRSAIEGYNAYLYEDDDGVWAMANNSEDVPDGKRNIVIKKNYDLKYVTEESNEPSLYTVNVWENHQEDVLEWKERNATKEQLDKIDNQLVKEGYKKSDFTDRTDGGQIYHNITRIVGSPKKASEFLLRAGIDGIKYPVNALSGGKGEKGYNYVVFDADAIKINQVERYSIAPQSQVDEVRKQYEGTPKYLKAPNGKPTNLNELQWLQVRTQNFKNWFGDWENDPANASKVVDENGEPMVVYHGSGGDVFKPISVFKQNYDMNMPDGDNRKVTFFAKEPSIADNYAITAEYMGYSLDGMGANVYPVFLNIRNITDIDAGGKGGNGFGGALEKAFIESLKNNADGMVIRNVKDSPEFIFDPTNRGDYYYAKQDLYGRIKTPIQTNYAVFNPTQIKSATANTGAFDPNNADIRYSLTPDNISDALALIDSALKQLETMIPMKEYKDMTKEAQSRYSKRIVEKLIQNAEEEVIEHTVAGMKKQAEMALAMDIETARKILRGDILLESVSPELLPSSLLVRIEDYLLDKSNNLPQDEYDTIAHELNTSKIITEDVTRAGQILRALRESSILSPRKAVRVVLDKIDEQVKNNDKQIKAKAKQIESEIKKPFKVRMYEAKLSKKEKEFMTLVEAMKPKTKGNIAASDTNAARYALKLDMDNFISDYNTSEKLYSLSNLESKDRHNLFKKYMNEEQASKVNALFEEKLLLKYKKIGIINWIEKLSGFTPEIQRDLITRVNKWQKVLSPAENEAFLEDLAKHKMGLVLTRQQSGEIFRLAQAAQKLKDQKDKTPEENMAYGFAVMDFNSYVNNLKESADKLRLIQYLRPSNYKRIGLGFLEITRALKATGDFSGSLRNSWGVLFNHPVTWSKYFVKQFDVFFKTLLKGQDMKRTVGAYIVSHPMYDKAKQGGLAIANPEEAMPTDAIEKLSQLKSEKAFINKLLAPLRATGTLQKAFQDSFTESIHFLRMELFDIYVKSAEKAGVNLNSKEELQAIASLVNSMTGRGGKSTAGKGSRLVNAAFFAPKLMIANFNQLTGHVFDPSINSLWIDTGKAKPSAFAQKQAGLNLLSYIVGYAFITALTYGLSKAFDIEPPELDPRSSDFGKIVIGNTRIEFLGGKSGYISLVVRAIAALLNKYAIKNSTTQIKTKLNQPGYNQKTAFDLFVDFFSNKLSPGASILKTYLKNKTFEGKPPTPLSTLEDSFVPIIASNIYDCFKDPATDRIIGTLFDVFGASANTYSVLSDWSTDQGKMILAFKEAVSDKEFKQANDEYNDLVSQWLVDNVNSPDYLAMSEEEKQNAVATAKRESKAEVFANHGFDYEE